MMPSKTITVSGPGEVELPEDLNQALRGNAYRWKKWQTLSYANRRELVEAIQKAKRPDTRSRRLASTLQSLDAQ
jgi:uncharacterized protein YdeI (YjbR/CyaY-like superfamily)